MLDPIFVVGPSGSGTTLVGRILASTPGAAAIAGNHAAADRLPGPLADVSAWLDGVTTELWDERAGFADRRRAEEALRAALAALEVAAGKAGVTRVVWKRSAPFLEGNEHAPDLRDLPLLGDGFRVLVVTRDPRASAASALRRGHHPSLRRAALVCAQRTRLLADQAAACDRATRSLRYEAFCADPGAYAEPLAAFLGLDAAALRHAIEAEGVAADRVDGWRSRVKAEDAAALDALLDERIRDDLRRRIEDAAPPLAAPR